MSMPWEAAVRASAVVERIGMITMVYVGETLLITPYDDIEFGKYKSNEGYLSAKKVVPSVAEYIATNHISVDKMFIRSQDPVMLVRARAQLEQIPGIRVMSSATDNLEVITPAADKGVALGMLCRELGTDLDHAAAIGDSENDLEMLNAVALPDCDGKRKRSRQKSVPARDAHQRPGRRSSRHRPHHRRERLNEQTGRCFPEKQW